MDIEAFQRIFISHSSEDLPFVHRLAQDLRHTLGNEITVWYDAQDLKGGETWWSRIVEELQHTTIFLVVLSPAAVESKWVEDEIAIAWRLKNSTGMRLIPLLYQKCEVRPDLMSLYIIDFLDTRPYEEAFRELLDALSHHAAEEAQIASNSDEAFTDVARGIRQTVEALTQTSQQRNVFGGVGSEAPRNEAFPNAAQDVGGSSQIFQENGQKASSQHDQQERENTLSPSIHEVPDVPLSLRQLIFYLPLRAFLFFSIGYFLTTFIGEIVTYGIYELFHHLVNPSLISFVVRDISLAFTCICFLRLLRKKVIEGLFKLFKNNITAIVLLVVFTAMIYDFLFNYPFSSKTSFYLILIFVFINFIISVTLIRTLYKLFSLLLQFILGIMPSDLKSELNNRSLVNSGATFLKKGQFHAALAAYEQAIALSPNIGWYHSNKGLVLWHLGRYEKAITACEQAIQLDPKLEFAHFNKAMALRDSGRYQEGLAAIEKALCLKPSSPNAYALKAELQGLLLEHKK